MGLARLYRLLARACPLKPPSSLTARLDGPLRRAAIGLDPATHLQALFLLAALSLAGLALILTSPIPLPLALPAIAALILTPLIPHLHLQLAIADRARSSEEELPFLILLAALHSPHQVHALPRALDVAAGTGRGLLDASRREALLEAAWRRFRAANPLASLILASKDHPSRAWRRFIEGYVAVSERGGDVAGYLVGQLEAALNRLRERWQGLARRTSGLVEVAGIILALTPSMAAMTMFVYPAGEAVKTLQGIVLLLPAAAILLVAFIGLAQPIRRDRMPRMPLLLALSPAPIAPWLASWLGMGTALLAAGLAGLAAATPLSEHAHSRIRRGEEQITRLLRDLRDLLQVGFSPLEAFTRLDPRGYPGLTRQLLQARLRLEVGIPPSRALQVDHPSWFVRVCFYALAVACEAGGGTSEIQLLTSFAERYGEARRAMARETVGASAIALAIPFISAFGLTTLAVLGEQAASLVAGLGEAGALRPRQVLAWAHLASAESSILMGFILSKTAFGTISSLLYPLILTAGATLASHLFGLMGV